MTGYVSQAMRLASNDAAILLTIPGADPYFEVIIINADRVFNSYEVQMDDVGVIAKLCQRLRWIGLHSRYLEILFTS